MRTDTWISRSIAATVCILTLVATIGYVIEPRDNLKELVLLLTGGLIGRLSTSTNGEGAQDVSVVNPSSDPIPTTEE